MADRYTRIYIDDKEKYCVGAPIIISACALLHDNKTNGIVAQVKLKSISDKVIKAVKVSVKPLDTAGRSLGDSVIYSYLDLNIKRDDYFGSQNAISMPDNTTRAIDIKVIEIIQSDNTIIDCSQNSYKLLPKQRTLYTVFGDEKLVSMYKANTTNRAIFESIEFENLWLCSCGATNTQEDVNCHLCGLSHIEQKSEQDIIEKQKKEIEYNFEIDEYRKKCINQYWIEHPDEKQRLESKKSQLEAEKNRIKNEIESVDLEISEQKRDFNYDSELQDVQNKLNDLITEVLNLGLFKVKEKKALQEQIDILYQREHELQSRDLNDDEINRTHCEVRIKELENRKITLNTELDEIKAKINEIENELTIER